MENFIKVKKRKHTFDVETNLLNQIEQTCRDKNFKIGAYFNYLLRLGLIKEQEKNEVKK